MRTLLWCQWLATVSIWHIFMQYFYWRLYAEDVLPFWQIIVHKLEMVFHIWTLFSSKLPGILYMDSLFLENKTIMYKANWCWRLLNQLSEFSSYLFRPFWKIDQNFQVQSSLSWQPGLVWFRHVRTTQEHIQSYSLTPIPHGRRYPSHMLAFGLISEQTLLLSETRYSTSEQFNIEIVSKFIWSIKY